MSTFACENNEMVYENVSCDIGTFSGGISSLENTIIGESQINHMIERSNYVKEEVKLLSEFAILPIRGTEDAACIDLFSPIDCVVPAHKNLLIKTDIALAWDNPNYYVQLLSRSGLCYKHNVVSQCGCIDIGYQKNIGVILQNNSDVDYEVKRGDRISQYTYLKIAQVESRIVEEFSIVINSSRSGGYGSTGR